MLVWPIHSELEDDWIYIGDVVECFRPKPKLKKSMFWFHLTMGRELIWEPVSTGKVDDVSKDRLTT